MPSELRKKYLDGVQLAINEMETIARQTFTLQRKLIILLTFTFIAFSQFQMQCRESLSIVLVRSDDVVYIIIGELRQHEK